MIMIIKQPKKIQEKLPIFGSEIPEKTEIEKLLLKDLSDDPIMSEVYFQKILHTIRTIRIAPPWRRYPGQRYSGQRYPGQHNRYPGQRYRYPGQRYPRPRRLRRLHNFRIATKGGIWKVISRKKLDLKHLKRKKNAKRPKTVKRSRFVRVYRRRGVRTALFGLNRKPRKRKRYKKRKVNLTRFISRFIKKVMETKKSKVQDIKEHALEKALLTRILNKKRKLVYSKTWRIMEDRTLNRFERLRNLLVNLRIKRLLQNGTDVKKSTQVHDMLAFYNHMCSVVFDEKEKKQDAIYNPATLRLAKTELAHNLVETRNFYMEIDQMFGRVLADVRQKEKKKHLHLLTLSRITKDGLEQKLSNRILLDFVLTAKLEMGERIFNRHKNEQMKYYFMAIRNKHAIYNINVLFFGLRLTLALMSNRMKYKKKTLINYSNPRRHRRGRLPWRWHWKKPRKSRKYVKRRKCRKTRFIPPSYRGLDGHTPRGFKPVQEFPKKHFVVTWKKWIGGILTNFKRLSKRIISKMQNDQKENISKKQQIIVNNKKKIKEAPDYFISFARDIPQLPAFTILTSDCHWALNESKALRIPSTQLVEISHLGYFGNINLAMNTHYFGLRSFTYLLREASIEIRERAKVLHSYRMDLSLATKTLENTKNAARINNMFLEGKNKGKLFNSNTFEELRSILLLDGLEQYMGIYPSKEEFFTNMGIEDHNGIYPTKNECMNFKFFTGIEHLKCPTLSLAEAESMKKWAGFLSYPSKEDSLNHTSLKKPMENRELEPVKSGNLKKNAEINISKKPFFNNNQFKKPFFNNNQFKNNYFKEHRGRYSSKEPFFNNNQSKKYMGRYPNDSFNKPFIKHNPFKEHRGMATPFKPQERNQKPTNKR